MQILTVIRS